MPSKYDEITNAQTVRLVREHCGDYVSEWAAMGAIASGLGMNAETLRRWVRQAEIDDGGDLAAPGADSKPGRYCALSQYDHAYP